MPQTLTAAQKRYEYRVQRAYWRPGTRSPFFKTSQAGLQGFSQVDLWVALLKRGCKGRALAGWVAGLRLLGAP